MVLSQPFSSLDGWWSIVCVCFSCSGQWLLVEVTQPPGWIISSRVIYSFVQKCHGLPRPWKRFSVPVTRWWHELKVAVSLEGPLSHVQVDKDAALPVLSSPFFVLPSSLPFSSKEDRETQLCSKYNTEWDWSLKFSLYYLGEENSPREESPKGKWAVAVPLLNEEVKELSGSLLWATMSYLGIKMRSDYICFFRWPSAHLKNHDVETHGDNHSLAVSLSKEELQSSQTHHHKTDT